MRELLEGSKVDDNPVSQGESANHLVQQIFRYILDYGLFIFLDFIGHLVRERQLFVLLNPVDSVMADDLRHPVSKGSLATILKAVDAGEDDDKTVMHDVERIFPLWHIPQRHTHRKSGESLIETPQRLPVARLYALYQLSFRLLHDYLIFFFALNTNSQAELPGLSSSSMAMDIFTPVFRL